MQKTADVNLVTCEVTAYGVGVDGKTHADTTSIVSKPLRGERVLQFEASPGGLPGEITFENGPSGASEPLPQGRIFQYSRNSAGESLWLVRNQNVLSLTCREAFAANRGGDDGPGRSPRFEDFKPRPAPGQQRSYYNARAGKLLNGIGDWP